MTTSSTFLIEQHDDGNYVTLIIDEAQHLGLNILEQLRMLSNVNTERGQILQVILVGQPELSDLLRRPEIQQFAQRISYDYFLGPLESVNDVAAYIRHRLSSVCDRDDIFDESTFDAIFRASGGTPRLINLICDTALVYAFAEELDVIPLRIIEQVLHDKRIGLAPLEQVEPAPVEAIAPAAEPCAEPAERRSAFRPTAQNQRACSRQQRRSTGRAQTSRSTTQTSPLRFDHRTGDVERERDLARSVSLDL